MKRVTNANLHHHNLERSAKVVKEPETDAQADCA